MAANNNRIAILTAEEIAALYDQPHFDAAERQLYFSLSDTERQVVDSVHTINAAVHLVLQLGYFKSKRRFFVVEPCQMADDVAYVVARYFSKATANKLKALTKPTRLEQQRLILELFRYRICGPSEKEALATKARRTAMLSTQPGFILRELLQYMEGERLVVPGYSSLQDIVGQAVIFERRRITKLLERTISPEITELLDKLLTAGEFIYRISAVKREAKDFSYGEMKREVERRQTFQPLHDFAKNFLANSGLSVESGKYYASLVKYYSVYKLKRIGPETARLYLLCFAYHRFRQINDTLIEAFTYLVHKYEAHAKHEADEAMKKALVDASENLEAAGDVLILFADKTLKDETPFKEVKERAYTLLDAAQIPVVANYLRKVAFDKIAYEWSYYAGLSAAFKRNLRHLFCELQFAGRVEDAPLMDAITFLRGQLREGKVLRQIREERFPLGIIPNSLKRYLYVVPEPNPERPDAEREPRLNADRYEFLVYLLVRKELEAGNIYVRDSVENRRFEDDLISDERWEQRDEILREIGAELLLRPIDETLASFAEQLERKFDAVNKRIEQMANQHVKVRGTGQKRRWTLAYPSSEEPINGPFYGKVPGINVADLLRFVARDTRFLDSFTHVLERYVKQAPAPRELIACILAMATNMGLGKMADVSGLSLAALMNTARSYMRQETLHAANDAISNATAALPAFQLYNIRDEIHSSSDGQRIETQIDTVNARFSPKYFGLDKGVSANTVVANNVPVNAKVIGTNEHESHYVYDLLYNNNSDIQPVRHSTDTHGTNQVNFWILLTFGYQFAPRYRDLRKKMDKLVGFRNPSDYGDLLIKPFRKVDEPLIIAEWPTIQRIMASLAQKDVTQATIVRKLSSYTRQNQTKKALWELDNICRTMYLLDFIDDATLRQAVQKALNRGEAYHRFRRTVSYVNGGKFRVKTEAEQQIWNDCARLVVNAIIYYNTLLLSKVYVQKLATGDNDAIEALHGISPIAWRHVNLVGRFDFTTDTTEIDIDALVAPFADPEYWRKALVEDAGDAAE